MLALMTYIRYGNFRYDLPDGERGDGIEQMIRDALASGNTDSVIVTAEDGTLSELFITPGVPISFHDWDRF